MKISSQKTKKKSLIQKNLDIYENLITNIQGGVIVCQFNPATGKSKVVYLSEGWTELTGYTLDELNQQFDGNPQALICPEDAQQANDAYTRQTSQGDGYQLEYRIRHKDGRQLWTIDRGIITQTEEGLNQNQSIITDITSVKENAEKLRLSEARLRIATKASQSTIFEYDIPDRRYVHIENAEFIFQKNEAELCEELERAKLKNPQLAVPDVMALWFLAEDVPTVMLHYEAMLSMGTGDFEIRVVLGPNQSRWCKINIALICDEQGNAKRVIGHITNIDEQHQRTERLLLEAQKDALTGLLNKSATEETVKRYLTNAPDVTHALIVLDIDNFKRVNDSMGHLFGDAVLMDVSNRLKKNLCNGELLGRIGGDEFLIFISGETNREDVERLADTICKAMRHTYQGEKADYKTSCSVGIAFSRGEEGYLSLFRKADTALYHAKARGKDGYSCYCPECSILPVISGGHMENGGMTDSGSLMIKERVFGLLYSTNDFTGSLHMVMALAGQLLEADRVYLCKHDDDNMFTSNFYEWCAQGVSSQLGRRSNILLKDWNHASFFDEDGIFEIRDFEIISPAFRAMLEEGGVKTSCQAAIMEEGKIRGFMGCDFMKPHSLSPEQRDIMAFVARVVGTFMIKKQAEAREKLYNENKVEALENLPCALYVIDSEYRLHYFNNRVKQICPETLEGQKCHETFMRQEQPCPGCPAAGCGQGPCSAEIYNPYTNMWMIATAATIKWSGQTGQRLVCCQEISDYKN